MNTVATDLKAAEHAIADFLRALGHDPDGDAELRETPARVARAFATELLSGYEVDVSRLILEASIAGSSVAPASLVAIRNVAVATLCPHHLLPSFGRATIAYLPGQRVLGVGTLIRLVDAYARRLMMQEALGQCVVEALMQHAGARGAYCRLALEHGCVRARGSRSANTTVHTVAAAGELSGPSAATELALALQGAE